MTKTKLPKFKSLEEERAFWDTHDVFEVLGEDGWEIVDAGKTKVKSVYVTRIGEDGQTLRLHPSWLKRIGIKSGDEVRVWVKGRTLVLEPVCTPQKLPASYSGGQ